MDFPAYVPAAVRAHITTLIEGDSREPMGWQEALSSAERELAEIESAIETKTRRGEVDSLDGLRKRRAEAAEHRDRLVGDMDCLRRLAHDDRMQEAYTLLTSELLDDKQLRGFVYAAWAARADYSKYRKRLKRAAELKEEISVTAETLAKLIRQFSDTGINGPSEFYSVPELLRKTDNHELRGHNLHMWRFMRKHVLGDPQEREPEPDNQNEPALPIPESDRVIELEGVSVHIRRHFVAPGDPVEHAPLAGLRYGWGVSPDLSELLDTVSKAAREFKPTESGMIGAAIDSRQRSEKTEYLRAFANLLIDVHHIDLTNTVMRAMAIVANVAINQPDIAVMLGDVRQTLAGRLGKPDV